MESVEINKCVICFNNIDEDVHIHVPMDAASNIIGKCSVHLHSTINNDVFDDKLLAYQNEVQFCKQCFDHTVQLTELSDQLSTLQKKLLDLSITVSLDILCRRNQLEHTKEENDPMGSRISLNTKKYSEEYGNESDEDNCNFVITDTRTINSECDIPITPYLDVLLDETPNTDEFDHPINEEDNYPQDQTDKDVGYIVFDIKKPTQIPRIMIQRNSTIFKGLHTTPNQKQVKINVESNGIVSEGFKETKANAVCDVQDNSKSCEDRSSSSSEKEITITTTQDVAARLGLQSEINTNNMHIKINVFGCGDCHRVFARKNELEIHKQVHARDSKRRHKCSACKKSYLTEWQLQVHGRIHTGEKPYKCSICDKTFNQQTMLNNHKRLHTGVRPYKCSICDKTFNQQTMLNNHKRIHTGERPYKCTQCEWAFTQASGLRSHQTVHTGVKPYKCHYCQETFKYSSSRSKHERKNHIFNKSLYHNTQIPKRKYQVYPPSKSKISLKRRTHLQSQKMSQTGNQPVCEKTMDNAVVDPNHRKNERVKFEKTDNNKKLSCMDPNKQNQSSAEKKPYKCELCNRGFLQKRYLIIHERIHSGEKPFKCFYCEKAFMCTSTRSKHHKVYHQKRHIVMSKKETPGIMRKSKLPYKHNSSINTASHLQVQKNNLIGIKHFKTATHNMSSLKTVTRGGKPFRCTHCGRTFKYKRHLIVHERIHTGEKPFKCEQCDLTFTKSSAVKIHSRIHTGEKPFKCLICGKAFTFASSRWRHQKIHGKKS